MNRENIIALFATVAKHHLLEGTLISNRGRSIQYIQVFQETIDSGKKVTLGIDEQGYWCRIDEHASIWRPTEPEHFFLFYEILLFPLTNVLSNLSEGLQKFSFPEKVIYSFPFDDLLLSAYSTHSWRRYAKEWITEGFPMNDQLRLSLSENNEQSKSWIKWRKKRLRQIIEGV